MKKIVIVLAVMLLMSVTGCGKKQEEQNPTIEGNTNEGIIQDQTVGNLKFTNTALIVENGQSKLTTLVTNDTDEDIRVETFDIYVKDASGKTLTVLQGYVGGIVPKHEARQVISQCSIDLSHATNIEYQINES